MIARRPRGGVNRSLRTPRRKPNLATSANPGHAGGFAKRRRQGAGGRGQRGWPLGDRPLSERKEVVIYTRGVSSRAEAGGYAAILVYNSRRKEIIGGAPKASNNRMDIQAAIAGLKALKESCRVTLYNNNTYLVDAIVKGWAAKWRARGWTNSEKQPTVHADLWEELSGLCAVHEVEFVYRRLDGNSQEMARCDLLAHGAAKAQVLAPAWNA